MIRVERIDCFVSRVWDWYAENKRNLPWRDLWHMDETARAYRVFVSEVMLQQTQVSRVVAIYRRFLGEFPMVAALATATNRDVVLAWRGMGYNRRALMLRDSAATIVEKFAGTFPEGMEELQSLPGIGHYTAAAVRNFAFGIPTPCVETNIRRVLHTTFVGPPNADGTWKKDDAYLRKLAGEVLEVALKSQPETGNRKPETCQTADWHHALMDYGALVVAKEVPKTRCLRRREPGRLVGSRFVPNRIFRGRIVDALRDAAEGMQPDTIGRHVCIDWEPAEHGRWLRGILSGLEEDALIERRGGRYVLAS